MSSYQSSRRSSISPRDQTSFAPPPLASGPLGMDAAYSFRRSTSTYMSDVYGSKPPSVRGASRSQSPELPNGACHPRSTKRDSAATLLMSYAGPSSVHPDTSFPSPSQDRYDRRPRADSIQSIPWDEEHASSSGRATPTASRGWSGDVAAVHTHSDAVNGLRVSIDPTSFRGTMYGPPGTKNNRPESIASQFSPIPAALTAAHSFSSTQLEFDHPRTFSMLYSKTTQGNAGPDFTPATSVGKGKKPLPLPGQPSPLTPKTPRYNHASDSLPMNGLHNGPSTYLPSPLAASSQSIPNNQGESLSRDFESDEEGQNLDQEDEAQPEEGTHDAPPRFSSFLTEPPVLKLDLDFGSDTLFSDLSFGNATSSLASSLGLSLGLDFTSPRLPASEAPETTTDSSLLSPSASLSSSTNQVATPNAEVLSSPPSRKSSIRTVTNEEQEAAQPNSRTPSPSLGRSLASPPASIALPPSRPLSPFVQKPVEDDAVEASPVGDTLASSAVRSRQDSQASNISQLSRGEVKLATKRSSSAKSSNVDLTDLKPVKPLFSSGRQSQASINRDRSGSASSVQQQYSRASIHSQSPERLGSDHVEGVSYSNASSSRNSHFTNVNKQLPAPPPQSTTQRILRPLQSRPSGPDRGSSIRKTSAQASAAAANLLSKGKHLMSRSHPLQHGDVPGASPTSEVEPPSGVRKPVSRASIASLFKQHSNDASKIALDIPSRRISEERQPHPTASERRSSVSTANLYPVPASAVKKPLDMLKPRKTSNAPAPDDLNDKREIKLDAQPEEPKVAEVAAVAIKKPESESKTAGARRSRQDYYAEKRPTTDQLLALASAKLAKIAAERQSATPSSGSTHSQDASSAATPSTGASSPHQLIDQHEKYSLAQAIRIKRPETIAQAASLSLPARTDEQAPRAEAERPTPVVSPPPPLSRAAPKLVNKQELSVINTSLDPPLSAESPRPERRTPSNVNLAMPDKPSSALASSKSVKFPRSPKPPMPIWQKRAATPRSDEYGDQIPPTWTTLEDALEQYTKAFQLGQSARSEIVQSTLLPFLRRAESGQECLAVHPAIISRQKELLFSWLDLLAEELRGIPANRGSCLDGVAAIMESRLLSADALADDPDSALRFRDSLVAVLDFAVEKLNEKAVYANTLSFSGRLLAVAFFRIEGVGLKLLRLLPIVKRQDLKRVLQEVGIPTFAPPPIRTDIFPEHLHELCFKDITTYAALLTPLNANEGSFLVQSNSHSVRMHGNWLIRWQASDSDLPFGFYRAYHKQLAALLQPPAQESNPEFFLPSWEAMSAPGFLFLAASLLEKIDSLIHRNLRSVTTLGPSNGSFNSQDSANMTMGAKPKVLEHANRRVVSTILDIVGGPARPSPDPDAGNFEGLFRRRFFGGMLQVWVRAVVKRTSMFDARGVFLLLDFIEGLFCTVSAPITPPSQLEPSAWHPSIDTLPMFDNKFILSFVRIIFEKADNTICLMRTVTFLYSLFEAFTLCPEDKIELCQKILLHPDIFQRMFLFWNSSVRGYYLRLIVWRLSRLGISSADGRPIDTKDSQTILILQTLNSRLEGIRKRHDEIDPLEDLPDDDLFDSYRCSVDSTRGVQNQPWTVEELTEDRFRDVRTDETEPQDKWFTAPENIDEADSSHYDQEAMPKAIMPKDNVAVSKMVHWLKVLKTGGKKMGNRKVPESRIQPFDLPSQHSSPSSTQHLADDEDTPSLNITMSRPASMIRESPAQPSYEPTVEPIRTVSVAPSRHLSTQVDADLIDQPGDLPTQLTETDEQDNKEQFPFLASPNPDGNTFFKFEFETSTMGAAEANFEGKRSRRASTKTLDRHSLHNGAMTPSRRPVSSVTASPRVSKRFSKRASILPPPALDLLMESSEPVPQIPKEYQEPPPYPMPQHPYAIRGLREYEDALDEYDIWLARLEENEEDLEGREQGELVPKLSVLWPLSFSDD